MKGTTCSWPGFCVLFTEQTVVDGLSVDNSGGKITSRRKAFFFLLIRPDEICIISVTVGGDGHAVCYNYYHRASWLH